MKRPLFQRWAIWLLPLLLVRAIVPAGFMLSAHAGELSLAFCSGFVTAAQRSTEDSAHQHHASHSSDASDSGTESSNAGTSACPFAASGTAASFELPHFIAQLEPLYERPSSASLLASSGPQRAERIRGPPASI